MSRLLPKSAVWIVFGLVALNGLAIDPTRQHALAEDNVELYSDGLWLIKYQGLRNRFTRLWVTVAAPLLSCVPDWTSCKAGNEAACISTENLQNEVAEARRWWSFYPWAELENLKNRTLDEDFRNMGNQLRVLTQSLRNIATAEDPCSKIAQEGVPGRLRTTLLYLAMDRLDIWNESEMSEIVNMPTEGDGKNKLPASERVEFRTRLIDAYYFALSHRIAGTCLLDEWANIQELCRALLPYDDDTGTSKDRYASNIAEIRDWLDNAFSILRAESPDLSEEDTVAGLRFLFGEGNATRMLNFEDLVSPDLEIMAARRDRLAESISSPASFEEITLDEENALGTLTKYIAAYRGNGTDLR